MLCGVKFCGGCNPRYDRGKAFEQLRLCFADESTEPGESPGTGEETDRTGEILRFDFAKEGISYDVLLVFGGCPACCASDEQYTVNGPVLKMWEPEQAGETIEKLNKEFEKR